MRKNVFLLIFLLFIGFTSTAANDDNALVVSQDLLVVEAEDLAQSATQATLSMNKFADDNTYRLFKDQTINASATDQSRPSSCTRIKSITSISELEGDYVMTFKTLITAGSDGGKGVTITAIEGTDSISITNFGDTGCTVKAMVDTTSMSISIPNQVLGYSSTYGYYDLAVCTESATPDRTAQLEGTISNDGTITITSWWGSFITSGTYYNQYFGLYYNTLIEPANATMAYQTYASTDSTYTTYSYNVLVNQISANVITVKNFGNFGQTVEIVLRSDSTATIARQLVRDDQTNGEWYVYSASYNDDYTALSSYSYPIICDKATDARKISWGAWNMICTSYFYDYIISGCIEMNDINVSYPTLSVTSLDGDGTADSPFLIKTLDDLVFLSESVNTNDDYSYGSTTKYSLSYSGVYFRFENDIDMSDYRFTPIGDGTYHRFGGVVDGNEKTLTGLNINTSGNGYAGLFGRCDTTAVIKNLTLVNPKVETSGYYAAGIMAYGYGTIENCHVTGATITNTAYTGTGGIAGYVTTITDCSVTNSSITGMGGFTAGIAGQVNSLVSNCYVINTDIVTSGLYTAYPSGGIVGSLYGGSANNCYFTGTIDATAYAGLYVGGVVGTCYKGSVEKCFSTGEIYANGYVSASGGVVGCLYGDVVNCYSTAYISNSLAIRAGGITGFVCTYTIDDVTYQSSVKNSYAACPLIAYTYSYDTSTDLRETIGYATSGSSPTFENLYYDKQLVNYKSAQFGATTAEMTTASGLTGFDSSIWTFADGYYPRLRGMDETEAALLSVSLIYLDENSSISKLAKNAKLNLLGSTQAYFDVAGTLVKNGYYATIDDDSIKISEEFGNDTLRLINSVAGNKLYILKVCPVPFEGTGSETDPFLIQTKAELITLAEVTTNKGQMFPETYFLMTADIDLENDTTFMGISAENSNSENRFSGTFDGGGHYIHNMHLPDPVSWTTIPSDDPEGLGTPSSSSCYGQKGFVGRLAAEGVLKNVYIAADCYLDNLWAYSGAVVGQNYGTVDSCRNYSTVVGLSNYIGGIVGYNSNGGTVSNCYNAGSVTSGYYYVGGIAGVSFGLIENCENVADVTSKTISRYNTSAASKTRVGGIVGGMTGARIKNCVNSGTVSGYGRVGGLSGSLASSTSTVYAYANDVINCINYGAVISTDETNVGSIGGYSGTNGELADNYYDGQITILKANGGGDLDGTTAATTAVLTSGTALNNYSTDIWTFASGSYPVLKLFADEDMVKITSSVIINVADDETVGSLTSSANLSTSYDCSWTLCDGSVFKIESNKLVPPSEVKSAVIDTLVATAGTFVKPIVVRSVPIIPLLGEGTDTSPYLVGCASEWNALANYIAESCDPLTGKYVQLTADIDFSDTAMVALAYDRATYFNADLDGNGKTLSGFTSVADASYYGAVAVETGSGASIHDLTVDGTVSAAYTYSSSVVGKLYGKMSNVVVKGSLTTTKSYAGNLVAQVYEGSQITDCFNDGTVSSSSTYAAGLIGKSETGVIYENCGNRGSVTYTGTSASSYTAGLIAYCYPDTIIRCFNTGQITATSSSAGGLSGFIAMANSTKDGDTFYLEECYNTANISSASNNAGIILSQNSSGYAKIHMVGCYNTGDISSNSTSTKSSTYTAGLAAVYSPGGIYRNCWNSGTVTSVKPVYAAGLIAYYKGTFTSEDDRVTIVNCYNLGKVVATGNQGAGIVSYVKDYVTIDSCYNKGDIEGGFGLGGIANCLYGEENIISNSWNSGNVTTSANRAGGIIGYNTGSSTVTNCFNVGNISTTETTASSAYGIGGIAGQSGADFTNVYNTGVITGVERVGGLIGYTVYGSTSIKNGYSTGTLALLSGSGSYGNIVGAGTDNTTYWGEGNSMSRTYYLTANAATGATTDTASTGLSYAELAKLDLGDDWTAGDNYTYPRIATIADNDYAKAYAAAVVPADGDSYSSITTGFNVGTPDGVTWTASSGSVEIDGNNVTFSESFSGTLTMTATSGDVSVATELTCNVVVSGISDITGASREVVEETFYNLAGAQVAEPAEDSKAIYIVVKGYSDGTTETVKEIR